MDPYESIEEVWKWREKAYSKLDNMSVDKRISKINEIGRKYSGKLKLKVINQQTAK